jgi:hypothetical protein
VTSRPDPLRPPEGYGARPPEQAVKFTDPWFIFSGFCDHGTPRWHDAAEICNTRSEWVIWVGCRGEHMGQLELCGPHNALLDRQATFCSQCKERGHPDNQMVPIQREKV